MARLPDAYEFDCPDGYFFDRDLPRPQCRVNRKEYHVGEGLRAAVFAVSALALAWTTFNVVVLLIFWQSLVYKAASRSFMMLTLCLLTAMALGALLYAAIPEPNSSVGEAVCIGRAWLTCLPLAGILAILVS